MSCFLSFYLLIFLEEETHFFHCSRRYIYGGLPYSSDGKASACNAGDPGSMPGSGRSSGEENGNPL